VLCAASLLGRAESTVRKRQAPGIARLRASENAERALVSANRGHELTALAFSRTENIERRHKIHVIQTPYTLLHGKGLRELLYGEVIVPRLVRVETEILEGDSGCGIA
jgi:hypothetical protein